MKKKPLIAAIPDEKVALLLNDMAENIRSGTVEQWRAVAKFQQRQIQRLLNEQNAVRPSVAALVAGFKMIRFGQAELEQWLNGLSK